MRILLRSCLRVVTNIVLLLIIRARLSKVIGWSAIIELRSILLHFMINLWLKRKQLFLQENHLNSCFLNTFVILTPLFTESPQILNFLIIFSLWRSEFIDQLFEFLQFGLWALKLLGLLIKLLIKLLLLSFGLLAGYRLFLELGWHFKIFLRLILRHSFL